MPAVDRCSRFLKLLSITIIIIIKIVRYTGYGFGNPLYCACDGIRLQMISRDSEILDQLNKICFNKRFHGYLLFRTQSAFFLNFSLQILSDKTISVVTYVHVELRY